MSLSLTPGKIRRIQAVADRRGLFKILAVDHRDSMRTLIDPQSPAAVPSSTLTDIKLAVIRGVGSHPSGLLLDPVYSAAQAIVSQALPGQVGFLCALEEQGYEGGPHARQTTLLADWSVEKAARLGASGIKLLIFYHPDAGEATERQEELVRRVIADCRVHDIPLFLEPLGYPLDPAVKADSPEYAADRARITIETARRLGAFGPDVLKLPFPVDARHEPSPDVWRRAAEQLADACPTPWALLSFGDPFDVFKAQLEAACRAGCSGFMAGRAVWREVITAPADHRAQVVEQFVLPRFGELSEIAERHAKPWFEGRPAPSVDADFYRSY
jgi:tagatose-1,6-bisphosphate aldolase